VAERGTPAAPEDEEYAEVKDSNSEAKGLLSTELAALAAELQCANGTLEVQEE
jgi:hypothetical protein